MATIGWQSGETAQSLTVAFERQVAKCPDCVAIDSEARRLTYWELNQIANGLAAAILQARGQASEPVALLLEQGAPAIIGVLATLKAGKIYVPLDPSFPAARNQYILQDSQAAVVVTNNRNLELAKSLIRGQLLLNLDEVAAESTDDNPGVEISPDAVAYILSTSGSTGEPKGVIQTHRNVLAVLQRYTDGLHITSQDRLSLLPSYSVTAWIANTFGALLNGACLCPFDLKERGVTQLADWMIQHEVTIYRSVPTVFRHFVATLAGQEQFPKLRLIRLGGEPLTRRDVELYRAHFSAECVLLNGYGSSEISNVWQYRVDKNTAITGDLIPVGWPIDDTGFELVDEDGKAVTEGAIGEIVIRSRYLSPGYWRKPELTEAVFQAGENGERSYHTGDVGYLLPDGCLVHVGRKDFQVKIRGYRVETSEIEATLLAMEKVREAAVVAREDGNGDKQLVAYVVAKPQAELSSGELRQMLKQRLPEHMVPTAFVFLDALPMTANRKLDRTALPAPTFAQEYVAARDPIEIEIVQIWQELLHKDRIGIHDSFFELGGHSLLATRFLARVLKAFEVKIPIRSFFKTPTVAAVAETIEQNLMGVSAAVEPDGPEGHCSV
jgi:amino acid adenylation domain-containing protein